MAQWILMSTLIKFNPQMLECHLLYKRKATRWERKGLLTGRRDEKEANARRERDEGWKLLTFLSFLLILCCSYFGENREDAKDWPFNLYLRVSVNTRDVSLEGTIPWSSGSVWKCHHHWIRVMKNSKQAHIGTTNEVYKITKHKLQNTFNAEITARKKRQCHLYFCHVRD